MSRDRFHLYFDKRGVLAVFPMPGDYWRLLANTPDDHPPTRPSPTMGPGLAPAGLGCSRPLRGDVQPPARTPPQP